MHKQWLGIYIAAGLLAAYSSDDVQQRTVSTPQPAVCNGPTVEINGADPQYETPNATANQDYECDGESYKVIQDPANFTQAGFAAIYDAEPNSNLIVSGETFDPTQLTAAHPTLPISSYARITNLANGRMIVVRINDRDPYGNDRVTSLSRASADRLNTPSNTKMRIDPIIVAPDGSLSGPGMACTTIVKQTYALPARPNLDGGDAAGMNQPVSAGVRPISNSTLKPEDSVDAPADSGGFLGAPTPLNSGVLESSKPAATTAAIAAPAAAVATQAAPVTTPGSIQGSVATTAATAATASAVAASSTATSNANGNFVVRVDAVSDQARAQQYQQRLGQQFSVLDRVMQNGTIWRIQLGPFVDKAQANAVQQCLQSEAQLQSFITRTN